MSKLKTSTSDKIEAWIAASQSGKIYDVNIAKRKIFCRSCAKTFVCEKKSHIEQHETSTLHRNSIKQPLRQFQVDNRSALTTDTKKFYKDMCEAFISANIPWYKLENTQLKEFLQSYMGRNIPGESTLRKNYLHQVYSDVIEKIRYLIGNSDIWIAVDETTDRCGRYIAHLIIGQLSVDKPGVPHLLASKQLEKTNNITISRFINDSLGILWPSGIKHEKVKLFLSDGASYMLKAGNNLKIFYPNMIHFTCSAHGLNLVCETIRNHYEDVDSLISNVKKIFLKAPLRVQYYKDTLKDVPLPPAPVITRWGTWIRAAAFYAENFDGIKNVVANLDSTEARCIQNAQNCFQKRNIKDDLLYIKANFEHIVNSITQLETIGLTLVESMQFVQDVKTKLLDSPGNVAKIALQKLNSVLQKNPGYPLLTTIKTLLCGEVAEHDISFDYTIYKFAPITSCDAERSFSRLTNILTDKRTNFTVQNLEQYLVANANTF